MALFVYNTLGSSESAVGVGAASFGGLMVAHKVYAFASTTNCWIKQDAAANNPAASAGAGSAFVPAGAIITLDGSYGDTLSVIRDTADGKASLTPLVETR